MITNLITRDERAARLFTIEEIRAANAAAGQYFFSHDTMKFFRSRILPKVYQGRGGYYFITSEQFTPSSGVPNARKFTVRRFKPEDGSIGTQGDFNDLTRRDAMRIAARLSAGLEVE